MIRSFNYNFNRRTKLSTAFTLIGVLLIAGALYLLYTGGFFSAWFLSFMAALVGLMVLSIPRRIVLLGDRVEIQCTNNSTSIVVSIKPNIIFLI